MNNNPGIIPDYYFFYNSFIFFAHIFSNITPSTINVDNVNHTYTGTLSSSTYSGYKLAANSNRIVSAGNQTLTGYTGNNITLAISGNAVSVTNSKTSTNRTTELQNFIKSNWSPTTIELEVIRNEYRLMADVIFYPILKPALYLNSHDIYILPPRYIRSAEIKMSYRIIDIRIIGSDVIIEIVNTENDKTYEYFKNMYDFDFMFNRYRPNF